MYERAKAISGRMQFLTGAQLKTIAILSMLADHINKALIYPNLVSNSGFFATMSDLFDIIGRIAFPLFCFLLVEGYFKTRSRKKISASTAGVRCPVRSALRYVYNGKFPEWELE